MARPWRVPPMFEGMTVAVLASGPSMSHRMAKQAKSVSDVCIVTNDTIALAPWATLLYAADHAWWDLNMEYLKTYGGLMVTADERTDYKRVLLLKRTGIEGFDPDTANIRTGGNSGYQAIHVAIHAQAKRILLFGFDMHGTHWFGEHKKPLRSTPQQTFDKWIDRFEALTDKADIVNCTPGSAITCFPFAHEVAHG